MGLAGFLSGMIMPSRDMLVRAAAPPGAVGRAFGIVTTGFSIGGTVGPMLFGWIMDQWRPALGIRRQRRVHDIDGCPGIARRASPTAPPPAYGHDPIAIGPIVIGLDFNEYLWHS
jgi:MFS family permease